MFWLSRIAVAASALTLAVACFYVGRTVEYRAEEPLLAQFDGMTKGATQLSVLSKASATPNQRENVMIANVATVSFGELWDVVRDATPEKRQAWARELEHLPPGTKRNAAIESFYKIWVELAPADAARAVENIADSHLRRLAFRSLVDGAADSALPILAESVIRLGYPTLDYFPRTVIGRWADADPEATGRFLLAHPTTGSPYFLNLTYSWGSVDPEAAGRWLDNLRLVAWHDPRFPNAPDHRRQEAARGLLLSWVNKDQQGAATYARARADDPDIQAVLGGFTLDLCIRSPEEAKSFVQGLPNETSQRAAVSEILKNMRQLIVMREGGDDEEPEDPEIDAKTVPPWLADLPPALWIDHAGKMFGAWEEYDPGRANAWLQGLPPPVKTRAVIDFCASAMIAEADRVFELSSELDATSRKLALQKFVVNLQDFSSDARRDISSSHLTKQQKQRLLEFLPHD